MNGGGVERVKQSKPNVRIFENPPLAGQAKPALQELPTHLVYGKEKSSLTPIVK